MLGTHPALPEVPSTGVRRCPDDRHSQPWSGLCLHSNSSPGFFVSPQAPVTRRSDVKYQPYRLVTLPAEAEVHAQGVTAPAALGGTGLAKGHPVGGQEQHDQAVSHFGGGEREVFRGADCPF